MLGAWVDWYADRRLPGARTSAIARTGLIDNAMRQALRDNIRQIVVLGAGFDCRAYRLPGISSATVFEVDHQATHAWKLSYLRKLLSRLRTTFATFQSISIARTFCNCWRKPDLIPPFRRCLFGKESPII